MRKPFCIAAFIVVLIALAVSSLVARDLVLHKSPELVFLDPSGKETLLSSFQGKVIVIEFLFVRSPHCMHLVQMMNNLHNELGPRGFQPVAIAFGPDSSGTVLTSLVESFKLTYPIGSATSDRVDTYLGREGKEMLKIPQMVVIDRKGYIRAASGTRGEPTLENEASLRTLIDALLKESADNTKAPSKP